MTRVRVAPPDIEEDITAEQVAAYLLARGWIQYASTPYWRTFTLGLCTVNVPGNYNERNERRLAEAITDIARAEGRHPSAVLAAIAGPARAASVGRACAPDDRTIGRALCRFREAGARAQARGRRLSAEEAFEIAADDETDIHARGAGEESE